MTDQAAAKEAKKRWGKAAYIRNAGSFSSPEKRDSKRREFLAAKAEIEAIEAEIKERLAMLDWYQELIKRKQELRKTKDNAQGYSMYYRFTVGKSNGMFNEILGQGDTWAEAFEKANGRA